MKLELNENSKIVSGNKTYEYNEIFDAVLKIQNAVPKQTERIAICMEHNEKYLYTVLALINRRITYIPVLSSDPDDRIEYILQDCGVDTVIACGAYCSKFTGLKTIDVDKVLNNEVGSIITNDICNTNDIIYILYTSGTTGRPKGVAVTYDHSINFMEGMDEAIKIGCDTVMLYHTSYTFDINFFESVVVLMTGGTVVIADEQEYKNVKSLISLLKDKSVNTLQMTPSKLYLLIKYDQTLEFLNNISTLLIGGEKFPKHLLDLLQAKNIKMNQNMSIYNLYGPTETTIWSSVSDLTDKNKVDIGNAIKNAEIYIVDDDRNVLGVGEEGEIFVAGNVVAKGYINRDKLTKEKFINLNIGKRGSVYGFLTGDMGCINKDGKIECYNRKDNQVKFNGLRIEPEEIESVIQEYIQVGRCVVLKVDNEEHSELVAFCNKKDIDLSKLKQYMKSKLPHYMIPDVFCYVEEMPYTQSLKLDCKKLVEMYSNKELIVFSSINKKHIDNNEDEVAVELEKIIVESIKNGVSNVVMEEELKEIGINSISYIEIIVTVEERFEIEFDEEKLVLSHFNTFKEFVEYVNGLIKKNECFH